jgi:serine/threonine protein kinase
MSLSLGKYEVLEELGRGGMGRVLKARDPSLNRLVAIKVVESGGNPEIADRLKREGQGIALLSHPSIVTVFELIELKRRSMHRHGVHFRRFARAADARCIPPGAG